MEIDTRSSSFFITNPVSGNVTAASITYPVPQLAEPSGDGVIPMGTGGGTMCAPGLFILPYGAGTAAQTFTMAAYAWTRTLGNLQSTAPIWVASTLATFTCTLSTVPGLANTDVNSSQLFCGTIALVVGNANVSVEVVSPTGNTVASIALDAKGAKLVELRFGTGSSATSCNALVRRM